MWKCDFFVNFAKKIHTGKNPNKESFPLEDENVLTKYIF